jgi:hypothetical protein
MSIEYANFMREFERGPKRATAVTPASMLDARDVKNLAAAPVRERKKKARWPQVTNGVGELELARALNLSVPALRATWLNFRLAEPHIVVTYEKIVEAESEQGERVRRAVHQRRRRVYPGSAVSDCYVAWAEAAGAESALAQK